MYIIKSVEMFFIHRVMNELNPPVSKSLYLLCIQNGVQMTSFKNGKD